MTIGLVSTPRTIQRLFYNHKGIDIYFSHGHTLSVLFDIDNNLCYLPTTKNLSNILWKFVYNMGECTVYE
jgi:hypothetical protein